MVAAEQTGFSSGTPNDDDVCFAARSARNKNFLIKSLTCASRGRFVSFFVGTRRREKEKERKGLEPDGAGGDRSRKKTAPLYDARLDFAVYLVGTYRVSILFLFVLYVNSSPVGAQGQHQSMADGG